MILFRDTLRKDSKISKEYDDLKKELEEKYLDDRKSYTKSKNSFIESIQKKTLK